MKEVTRNWTVPGVLMSVGCGIVALMLLGNQAGLLANRLMLVGVIVGSVVGVVGAIMQASSREELDGLPRRRGR